MLTVGSLFAGIGGLDLGLERAGMQVKWQVEIDPYCIRVLERHWPDVKRHGNIKTIKWSEVEPVALICGGFPCQPVSVAGARKGDKDERWLWPEFLRAIREVRPRYALVENVPGLLSTDDGRLARGVFGDLAEIGYHAEWNIVSAADVGAPHRRQRIFIIAHAQSDIRKTSWNERPFALDWSDSQLANPQNQGIVGRNRFTGDAYVFDGRGQTDGEGVSPDCSETVVADSEGGGVQARPVESGEASDKRGLDAFGCRQDVSDSECEGLFSEYIPEARSPPRYSGFEQQWAVEPDVGRVANGVPSRVDRLKCLGNAVVPQVAEYIGKLIIEAEERQGRE